MLIWLVVTTIGLLGCLAFGVWPLLLCRRLAPVLRGTVGALCIAAGIGSFGAVCGSTAWAEVIVGTEVAVEKNAPKGDATESNIADSDSPASAPVTDEGSSPSSSPGENLSDVVAQEAAAAESSSAGESASSEPAAASSSASPADSIEIETEPEGVVIPPGRPEWVEGPPLHVGEVHTTPVSSGPYARMQDCWHELDRELVKATNEYIAEHLGSNLAPQFIRYDAKQIRTQLLKSENVYHERITVSIGPMHQVHALLQFGPEFRSDLDQRWSEVRRYSRLTQVGLGAGALLCLLSAVFGYFRLDNATRGYYTGRLQFLTAAAILAIVGVGVVMSRWVHWM